MVEYEAAPEHHLRPLRVQLAHQKRTEGGELPQLPPADEEPTGRQLSGHKRRRTRRDNEGGTGMTEKYGYLPDLTIYSLVKIIFALMVIMAIIGIVGARVSSRSGGVCAQSYIWAQCREICQKYGSDAQGIGGYCTCSDGFIIKSSGERVAWNTTGAST
jgi:hypothetical protein